MHYSHFLFSVIYINLLVLKRKILVICRFHLYKSVDYQFQITKPHFIYHQVKIIISKLRNCIDSYSKVLCKILILIRVFSFHFFLIQFLLANHQSSFAFDLFKKIHHALKIFESLHCFKK